MKRMLVALFVLFLAATDFGTPALATGKAVITIEALREMFTDMRTKSGYEKWNVDAPLLWGYFFTDRDERKLKPVAQNLVGKGYRLVGIYDDKSTFVLHVEKIEQHTPESLHQRNQEFYKLANQFHLGSYDGMDVGPVK